MDRSLLVGVSRVHLWLAVGHNHLVNGLVFVLDLRNGAVEKLWSVSLSVSRRCPGFGSFPLTLSFIIVANVFLYGFRRPMKAGAERKGQASKVMKKEAPVVKKRDCWLSEQGINRVATNE